MTENIDSLTPVSLDFEIKSNGEFEGYGNVFDILDGGRERTSRGCFKYDPLNVKMLIEHDNKFHVKNWDSVSQDDTGLLLKATIDKSLELPKEFKERFNSETYYEGLKSGKIKGLSVGITQVKSRRDAGVRLIQDAKLIEVSLVKSPMNVESTVTAVKASFTGMRGLERALIEGGFSNAEAKAIISSARDELKPMQISPNFNNNLDAFLSSINQMKG
jgi:HK97 family phage prohead protease